MWAPGIRGFLVSLIVVLAAAGSATAAGPRYRLTVLPTLGGVGHSHAFGINENGQVVGEAPDVRNCSQAVMWFRGQTRALGTLNATQEPCEGGSAVPSSSFASAINDFGIAAGASMKSDGIADAATFTAGRAWNAGFAGWLTDINNYGVGVGVGSGAESGALVSFGRVHRRVDDLPGWSGGHAFHAEANNDRGQIVGLAASSDGSTAGYLYSPGRVDFLQFGCCGPEPFDVNNHGDVVGSYSQRDGEGITGFMYSDGSVVDLGGLPNPVYPAPYSNARAVNDLGAVVGDSATCDPDFPARCWNNAVLFRDGSVYDLNNAISPPSNLHLISALDINERGQIVGYGGDDLAHEDHFAFLLTPVG